MLRAWVQPQRVARRMHVHAGRGPPAGLLGRLGRACPRAHTQTSCAGLYLRFRLLPRDPLLACQGPSGPLWQRPQPVPRFPSQEGAASAWVPRCFAAPPRFGPQGARFPF